MANGVPGLTKDIFINEVRAFMRDFPELNRLISGEESSDRMIEYCTWLAIDEWNTTPPLAQVSLQTFPSRSILLYLTIVHLLTSVGILKSRNRFNYNDGGFSVQTEIQDELYLRWAQMLRSQVAPQVRQLKTALNIEGGWNAGVGSEYGWIHGWFGLS